MSKTLTIEQHIQLGMKLKQAQETIQKTELLLRDVYPATKINAELRQLAVAENKILILRSELEEKMYAEHPSAYRVDIYFGPQSGAGDAAKADV